MEPAIIGRQIKRSFPQYAKLDDAQLGTKYLEKYGGAIAGVQSGQIDIKDISEKQRVGVSLGLEAIGFKPEEQVTAEERKKKAQLFDLSKSIDILEENYQQIELKGRGGGTLGKLLAGVTGGEAFTETADYEALRKSLIGPVARVLSGEVGVLTDQDIRRAEKLLPQATDAPSLAKKKLENLKKLIQEKGGPEAKPAAIENGGGLLQNFLQPFITTGKNIGLLGQVGISSALAKINPQLAAQLASGGFQEQARKISEKPQEAIAEQIGASGSILLDMLLFKGAGKAAKGTGKVLRPFKSVGEMRQAAIAEAAGQTISGAKILKALEKGRSFISPTQIKPYDSFFERAKPFLKGKISIERAVKLNHEANKAFTAAGKVSKSATAAFNKIMGDAIKSEIKKVAPNVATSNKLFELLYKGKEITKKAVYPAQTAIIYRLLQGMGL